VSDHASATFELPSPQKSTLRCSACANRACEALGAVPGVSKVECDAAGVSVRVDFDPGRLSESDLAVEMERFGLELGETVHHEAWRITGLD
jgi:copper chaperone CopZ